MELARSRDHLVPGKQSPFLIIDLREQHEREYKFNRKNRNFDLTAGEAIDADPDDSLRDTLQSRPSREGGFRKRVHELSKKRIIKNRNVIPHDYSMYEAQINKKPSATDLN